MFPKRLMSEICAAAILCGSEGVSAQTIYKQTDETGRTIFTDRPLAGAIVVPYVTFSSQVRDMVSPPRIATGARSDVTNALSSNTPMTSTYAANIDFNEATRRLQQARQSRQEGTERRPGEGTDAAGTAAMSKRYQGRQQKLERAVVAAEQRSHATWLVRFAQLTDDRKIDLPKLAKP